MDKLSPKKVPCKNDRKSHLQKCMLARYVKTLSEGVVGKHLHSVLECVFAYGT